MTRVLVCWEDSKGDKRVDDALGVIADEALAKLLGRVPDLVALADLLRSLGPIGTA